MKKNGSAYRGLRRVVRPWSASGPGRLTRQQRCQRRCSEDHYEHGNRACLRNELEEFFLSI